MKEHKDHNSYKTEMLNLHFNDINRWHIGGHSGFYNYLFKEWWKRFGLNGRGLLIGEPGKHSVAVKAKLYDEFPEIDEIYSVDLDFADINWDITTPYDSEISTPFDWIICQAVLEHVTDPPSAMRNMDSVLKVGGKWYGQACGSTFPEHRKPIDCYRFLPDALKAFCSFTNLEFVDFVWTPRQWLAAYEKR